MKVDFKYPRDERACRVLVWILEQTAERKWVQVQRGMMAGVDRCRYLGWLCSMSRGEDGRMKRLPGVTLTDSGRSMAVKLKALLGDAV